MTTNNLDLHGLDSEEAVLCLDRYINEKIMQNISEINVICGNGRGILKKAVIEYLKNNELVREYEVNSPFLNFGTIRANLIRL
jgi:DNA mismatch repair protein MutS2